MPLLVVRAGIEPAHVPPCQGGALPPELTDCLDAVLGQTQLKP